MKAQTALPQATVIKKIGKWTIEMWKNNQLWSLVVCDGFYTDFPVIHRNIVAYENPYNIPKKIKDYLYKNRRPIGNLLSEGYRIIEGRICNNRNCRDKSEKKTTKEKLIDGRG